MLFKAHYRRASAGGGIEGSVAEFPRSCETGCHFERRSLLPPSLNLLHVFAMEWNYVSNCSSWSFEALNLGSSEAASA